MLPSRILSRAICKPTLIPTRPPWLLLARNFSSKPPNKKVTSPVKTTQDSNQNNYKGQNDNLVRIFQLAGVAFAAIAGALFFLHQGKRQLDQNELYERPRSTPPLTSPKRESERGFAEEEPAFDNERDREFLEYSQDRKKREGQGSESGKRGVRKNDSERTASEFGQNAEGVKITEKDIQLVMTHVNVDRESAIAALKRHRGDPIDAIMELTK